MQAAADCNDSSNSNNTSSSSLANASSASSCSGNTSNGSLPANGLAGGSVAAASEDLRPLPPLPPRPSAAAAAAQLRLGKSRPAPISGECVGSKVEQLARTPSPSPHASPTKRAASEAAEHGHAHAHGLASEVAVLNSNSNSTSTSSSNSTTSSVIATPVLARNGSARPAPPIDEDPASAATGDDALGGGGGAACGEHRRSTERNELLATKTLPLHAAARPSRDDAAAPPLRHLKSAPSPAAELVTPSSWPPSPNGATNGATPPAKAVVAAAGEAEGKELLAAKEGDQEEEEDPLLQWRDMPQYLQFNPYVLKGYRPLQTFKGCLFSLFYWHNETINILTHAIPIFYILAIVPGLMPWEKEYRFLSFCHVFGSVAPWCGSFVYHLFMNIEKGETVYYRLLKLDMVGIWVSQSFGALPLVTATTFCFSYKWKLLILTSYCLFSLWGLYKALTASSPWQRRLCFALPFTMRSILTFLRTLGMVGGNRVALSHVYLQDGVSVLGGAIGAMRIPEKWFPGLVDYYLNSHNIMHVLVVIAVYSMHKATVKDFEWMSATTCNALLANATASEAAIDTTFGANIEL